MPSAADGSERDGARQGRHRRHHHHRDDEQAYEIDENGRDEDADTQRIALLGVVHAERDNDENEADQRAGRAARKHVEIVPVVHPRLHCLGAFPVHYNAPRCGACIVRAMRAPHK